MMTNRARVLETHGLTNYEPENCHSRRITFSSLGGKNFPNSDRGLSNYNSINLPLGGAPSVWRLGTLHIDHTVYAYIKPENRKNRHEIGSCHVDEHAYHIFKTKIIVYNVSSGMRNDIVVFTSISRTRMFKTTCLSEFCFYDQHSSAQSPQSRARGGKVGTARRVPCRWMTTTTGGIWTLSRRRRSSRVGSSVNGRCVRRRRRRRRRWKERHRINDPSRR